MNSDIAPIVLFNQWIRHSFQLWRKGVYIIKTGKMYVVVTLVLLLLFSPLVYEAIVYPGEINEENVDYPPRIMYRGALYKAHDYVVEASSELILVGRIETVSRTPPCQDYQTNIEDFLHCNLYILETDPDMLVVEYNKQLCVYIVDEG